MDRFLVLTLLCLTAGIVCCSAKKKGEQEQWGGEWRSVTHGHPRPSGPWDSMPNASGPYLGTHQPVLPRLLLSLKKGVGCRAEEEVWREAEWQARASSVCKRKCGEEQSGGLEYLRHLVFLFFFKGRIWMLSKEKRYRECGGWDCILFRVFLINLVLWNSVTSGSRLCSGVTRP